MTTLEEIVCYEYEDLGLRNRVYVVQNSACDGVRISDDEGDVIFVPNAHVDALCASLQAAKRSEP